MNKMKPAGIVLLFAVLTFVPLPAFSEVPAPGVPVSPRLASIGGLHAPDLSGFYSLFSNPAGLVGAEASGSTPASRRTPRAPCSTRQHGLSGTNVLSNLTTF